MNIMKIIFAGSPAIAVPSLIALCEDDNTEIAGILTNEDSRRGRNDRTLHQTEVAQAAQEILNNTKNLNFPILKPQKLDAAFREQVSLLKPDLLVSFAYGRIFGPKFLSLFPLGGINVHPSLLPKYRGPSPIQAAIMNRDDATGITIQTLAEKMDTGDIILQEEMHLTGRETTGILTEIMAQKAACMLPGVLKNIAAGTARRQPQDNEKANYCALITKEDSFLDWTSSAVQIEAKIRAFNPWPLCRTIHNGRELLLLKSTVYDSEKSGGTPGLVMDTNKQEGILIQTGCGILAVKELQYQMKKPLYWKDFLNGARNFTGSLLG